MTEDEMVGWHHQLNEHESEQTLGDREGQGSLVCCSPWGRRESDTTERLHFHFHPGRDLPCSSDGKESACNAGDLGSIPELGRSPGGGHSNPLQYSCLENPMDRGA